MFQGVRQNNLFYILEKGDNLNLKIGQVVSVSNPQPKYPPFSTTPTYTTPPEMVVDIKVKVGEEILEFKQLGCNQSLANSGNVIVSDNKESMVAEVEGLLRTSKQIIESLPYHEKVVVSCDTILRELNPQFAKEKEQEEKISELQERMGGIESTLGNMMNMLSDALGHSKSSKKNKDE